MYKNGTDAQQGPLVQILRKWSLDMMFESTNKQHLVRIYVISRVSNFAECRPSPSRRIRGICC